MKRLITIGLLTLLHSCSSPSNHSVNNEAETVIDNDLAHASQFIGFEYSGQTIDSITSHHGTLKIDMSKSTRDYWHAVSEKTRIVFIVTEPEYKIVEVKRE